MLNEYPNSHGYKWLKEQLNQRLDAEKFLVDNPQPNLNLQFEGKGRENSLYVAYYNDFANNLIATLKKDYPDLVFFTSFDFNLHLIDFKNQGALDYHIWFNKYKGISSLVGAAGSTKVDRDLRIDVNNLAEYWKINKVKMITWMDDQITTIATKAKEKGLVCGNTEGWGSVGWYDHPDLSWDWTKESAEICVDLAKKHEEYKFICTSSFSVI